MATGQCFSCYDHTMFQLFGQTKEFNPSKIAKDYVKGLEKDNEVDCVTCCRTVTYQRNEQGTWIEKVI